MLWARIAELPLRVDEISLAPLDLLTSSGWTRRSTVVRIRGDGLEGRGEDVCYEADDQRAFRRVRDLSALVGGGTFVAFLERLDGIDPFPKPPSRQENRSYRRWAFESAALDLALRQSERSLAQLLERDVARVEFVASLGLGSPATTAPLEAWLARVPSLRFKIDFAEDWNEGTIRDLARLGSRIAVVDFKAHYHGSF
ncbi:MAG: hypothetical protein KDB80_11105, partial [Planctomycetes bacterium]|nr:hypothetical protein [Planctomycetota bacterium]